MALVAHDFIVLVFGTRWEASIPMLQIIAISWIVVFQRILIGLVLRARGEQKILVSFASIAATVPVMSCIATATMPAIFGVIGFASRRFVIAPFVTLAIERKLQIPRKAQAMNLLGPGVAAATMTIAVIALQLALGGAAPMIRLAGSIAVGGIVYATALWLISPDIVLLACSLLPRYTKRG
jgi:PST family polysaccharide transporter